MIAVTPEANGAWFHYAMTFAARALHLGSLRVVLAAACAGILLAAGCAGCSGSGRHTTSHFGATAAPTATGPASGLARVGGRRSYALPDPRRRMQRFTVRDTASGLSNRVLVYLPAGYRPSTSRRYAVVLGLTGFPMKPEAFTKVNFLATADRLASGHRMGSSIFVIPQVNNPETLDTECVNGPAGDPQTDTWLSEEVPRWVVRHFHVRVGRDSWAVMGYSFGGWCAASLAMRHPGVFGAALVFSGYFELDFGRSYHPLTEARRRGYDLIRLARTAAPPVAMWVFASRRDSHAWPTTHRFLRAVRSPTTVTAVIGSTGGHHNGVYEPYTGSALTWLATTLRGFRVQR